jgi:uncharacterized protein YndB with AHSA1/START domain
MAETTFIIKREEKQIVMERVFDASRELVWKAFTDPDSLTQWWGPKKYTTRIDKIDVKPGGGWRFIQANSEGGEYAFNGEFREVEPPEKLSFTFEFEGVPGHIVLQTLILDEQQGKTKVTSIAAYDSLEDLDGMVNSGMESGARESWDRLAELIEKV